jgi:hypothetical protein
MELFFSPVIASTLGKRRSWFAGVVVLGCDIVGLLS